MAQFDLAQPAILAERGKKRCNMLFKARLLDISQHISGPFCSKILAGLGAEVIKVERPLVGDASRRTGPFLKNAPAVESSSLFLYLNTNKKGITLDLEQPTGQAIFKRLVAGADVLVENFAPAVLPALGLDYDSLHRINPALVMTSVSDFGQVGPYKDWKGYDINCSALGGITNTIGYPKRAPLTPPLHQGHHQAGLMTAIAIMLAVLNRDITGKGTFIDQSEAEAWATVHIGIGL